MKLASNSINFFAISKEDVILKLGGYIYMKKYYDLPEHRMVACLEWIEGYGTLEEAQKYFSTKARKIDKKEFNKLGNEYCNSKRK
jgi:hypothetical protein